MCACTLGGGRWYSVERTDWDHRSRIRERPQAKGEVEVQAVRVVGAAMEWSDRRSLAWLLLSEQALTQVVLQNWVWGARGRVYRQWWSAFQSYMVGLRGIRQRSGRGVCSISNL